MLRTALVFSATLLLGCSNHAEPGSCYRGPENVCVEYGRSEAAAGKRLCSGMTWTAAEKSCPPNGRLGTCTKKGSTEHVYGGAPNNYSLSGAKSACEHASGTFTPASSI